MNLSLTLGPLVLPLPRLLPLLALAVGLLVAWRLRRRYQQDDAEPVLWWALAAGFVVARLVYGLLHVDFFSQNPLDLLKFWQGGFEPVTGVIAMILTAVWLSRHRHLAWQPVYLPLLAGLATWGVLSWFTLAVDRGSNQPLPVLILETREGEEVVLDEYRGRPLVINLWATWCPPCRAEMPVLATAERENPDIGFIFLNQGEGREKIEQFLDEEALVLEHVLLDPFSNASRELTVRGIPTTFFYGADGRLVSSFTGELSYPRLNDFIKEIER